MIEFMVSMNTGQSLGAVDWQVVFELVLSYVQALAWPAVIMVAVALFRREISKKIGSLESAKGGGIEAKFFQSAIEDPTVSDEAKNELSKVWINMSTAKDEPEPRAATDQLARWATLRQGNFSPEVRRRKKKTEVFDEVLDTLRNLSDGKYEVSSFGLAVMGPGVVSMPDFSVQPANGLDQVPGFFVYVEDEDESIYVDRFADVGCLVVASRKTEQLSDWAAAHQDSKFVDWSDENRERDLLTALRDLHVFDHG